MDRELIEVPRIARISPGKSDCRFLDGDSVKILPIEFPRFLTPNATSFLCSVSTESSLPCIDGHLSISKDRKHCSPSLDLGSPDCIMRIATQMLFVYQFR